MSWTRERQIVEEILDQKLRISQEIGKPVGVLIGFDDLDTIYCGYWVKSTPDGLYLLGLRVHFRPEPGIQVTVN